MVIFVGRSRGGAVADGKHNRKSSQGAKIIKQYSGLLKRRSRLSGSRISTLQFAPQQNFHAWPQFSSLLAEFSSLFPGRIGRLGVLFNGDACQNDMISLQSNRSGRCAWPPSSLSMTTP